MRAKKEFRELFRLSYNHNLLSSTTQVEQLFSYKVLFFFLKFTSNKLQDKMAPRGLSIDQKRDAMVDLLRGHNTFFTLKELEKMAPKEKGISE